MRHHHHDRFVDGIVVGAILSDKKLSGDAAFWVVIMLLAGPLEFAFDHVGLILIVGRAGHRHNCRRRSCSYLL